MNLLVVFATLFAVLPVESSAASTPLFCGAGSRRVLVEMRTPQALWDAFGSSGFRAFGAGFMEQRLAEETVSAQTALLRALPPCADRRPEPLWLLGATIVTLSEVERSILQRVPDVRAMIPLGRKGHLLSEPSAPFALKSDPFTSGLARIGAPELRQQFPAIRGDGVRVGIIDTGIEASHPDLAGRLAAFRDFISPDNQRPLDDHGHGTHVAGTIAGGNRSGTAIGVAPGATLLVAKAFSRYGGSDDASLLAALQWMADPDGNPATKDAANLVSCSWNVDRDSGNPSSEEDPFCRATENLRRLGIVPVFSAGNDGPSSSSVLPPGACPAAFTVGATNDEDHLADFSSRGPVHWRDLDLIKPDIVAPGVDVLSSVPGGYGTKSGTSMSTPHVAGAVALVLQARPKFSPSEAMEAILRGAKDLGYPGKDNQFGSGRLDLLRAIQLLP